LEKKKANLVIGGKRIITNSLEENASSSTTVETVSPLTPVVEQPVPAVDATVSIVEQTEPVVEKPVPIVEHSVPVVEETKYVVKKIKGVKYIIDEENNLFSMDDNGNPKEVVGKKLEKGYKFFV
jgi:hypothetical protein